MLKLARISWRPFAIPLKREFDAAHGTVSLREGVILRVETTDGLIGLGEASPLPSFVGGGVPDILPSMPNVAATVFEHAVAEEVETWALPLTSGWRGEREGMPATVSGAVKFAFETALISIEAELAGLPFYRWFGERMWEEEAERRTVARAPVLPVNAVIGGVSPFAAAEQARAFVEQGYRVLKVKVGIDVVEDVRRVIAVRRAAGPVPEVRIDANGGWSFEQACDALERLENAGVSLVEQPVAAVPASYRNASAVPPPPVSSDFAAIRDLASRFPAYTFAADESLNSFLALRDWGDFATATASELGLGTVHKPMVLGLDQFLYVCHLADAGLPVIVTTTIDAGIATAAAMHVAACLPLPGPACGLATLDLLEGDIVTGVPPIIAGEVTLPETPGLGVTLDEPALERYAIGPWQEVRP